MQHHLSAGHGHLQFCPDTMHVMANDSAKPLSSVAAQRCGVEHRDNKHSSFHHPAQQPPNPFLRMLSPSRGDCVVFFPASVGPSRGESQGDLLDISLGRILCLDFPSPHIKTCASRRKPKC
jgi:hypothetical protein